MRQHRDSLPLTVVPGVAVGTLLVAALWPSLQWQQPLPWLAVAALTLAYLSWLRLAHDGFLSSVGNDRTWHRRYRIGAALRVVGRLLLGALARRHRHPGLDHRGHGGGGRHHPRPSLAFDTVAAGLFATPVLAPLVWLHWRSPDLRVAAMLVMLMVLGASILRVARQSMERARHVEELRRSDTANLRAAEHAAQRLREAEQIAGMGSFDWDLVNGNVHWSDHHFRLWGLGSAKPDAALFLSPSSPDDRARVDDELRAVLEGKRRHAHMRYRLVLTDGQVRHIEDRGEVYLDSGGRLARLTGIVHDITDQVKSEESLRLVEFTMNTIADPVGVIDDRMTYRLVNRAWCDANRRHAPAGARADPQSGLPQARQSGASQCRDAVSRSGTNAVVRDPSPSIATGRRILETRYFAFNEPGVGLARRGDGEPRRHSRSRNPGGPGGQPGQPSPDAQLHWRRDPGHGRRRARHAGAVRQ